MMYIRDILKTIKGIVKPIIISIIKQKKRVHHNIMLHADVNIIK